MKQIGIGLQNFHDTFGFFPPGSPNDDANTLGWGAAILPYMEQKPLYDQIDAVFTLCTPNNANDPQPVMLLRDWSGHPNTDSWANVSGAPTGGQQPWRTAAHGPGGSKAATNFLATYFCPSNALPKQDNSGLATGTYAGCIGNEVIPWSTPWGCNNPTYSVQNGAMPHDAHNNNTRVLGMQAIIDGTSNTLFIGETGKSANVRPEAQSLGIRQWTVWAGGNNDASCGGFDSGGNALCLTHPNFNINRRTGTESQASFGSSHPGGAQFLMGDGAVAFLTENINTTTYSNLGGRNDGQVASIP